MLENDDVIDIDFETRSEADIMTVGSRVYAEHPSTEILMISFSINGKKIRNWNPFFSKCDKHLKKMLKAAYKGYYIKAHHSEFEYWIWNIVGVRQFGWKPIPIEQFYDTMGEACAMTTMASLAKAPVGLGLPELKDPEGKRLINMFSKPSRKAGEHFKDPHMYPDEFMKFVSYCDQDVRTQMEISERCHNLSEFEHEVMVLTETMNVRGIPIDIDMVQGALDCVRIFQKKANKKAKRLIGKKNCPFDSLSQRDVVKKWLNENGCPIPNMQKEVIEKWLEEEDIPEPARTILSLRAQYAKSSTSKYEKMNSQYASDGRVHGFIKYHIARTGRWGGRGIQIQNFPKPAPWIPYDTDWDNVIKLIKKRDVFWLEWKYGNVMDYLAGALRRAICAPEGYEFVQADYSQIESRLCMWMADDPVGLKDFSGEGKIYEGMASTVYNIPASKVKSGSFERDIGKQTVLGAGFGMGPPKFIKTCAEKANITIDKQLSEKAIYGYRDRYEEVPKKWKEAEVCALDAVRKPGTVHKTGMVEYQMRGPHAYCRLPSGRELCYLFAEIHIVDGRYGPQEQFTFMGMNSYTNKWERQRTWGGTLFQNYIQATARDIMAYGMLQAEKNGFQNIFTVHDESVALVKKGTRTYKEFEDVLCTLPAWAKGCPVKAEGWQGPRYRK